MAASDSIPLHITKDLSAGLAPSCNCWALILAAGFSSRMSNFKPLLALGGETVLAKVAATYRRAGVNNIIVVSGHRAQEVEAEASRLKLHWVRNPGAPVNPEKAILAQQADRVPHFDMFSSVCVGLRSLPAEARQVFVHPVDVPLVHSDTIAQLLRRADEVYGKCDTPASVSALLPVFNGEPGHPPVLPASIFEAVLVYTGSGGLQGFLVAQERKAAHIMLPVKDHNILFDMDTDADYDEAQKRLFVAGGNL